MPQSRGNNGEIRKIPDFSKAKAAVMPNSSGLAPDIRTFVACAPAHYFVPP
jgi:hypothetical protein